MTLPGILRFRNGFPCWVHLLHPFASPPQPFLSQITKQSEEKEKYCKYKLSGWIFPTSDLNNGLLKVETIFINLNQMALKVTGEKNNGKKAILVAWEELWINSLVGVTSKIGGCNEDFYKATVQEN